MNGIHDHADKISLTARIDDVDTSDDVIDDDDIAMSRMMMISTKMMMIECYRGRHDLPEEKPVIGRNALLDEYSLL